LDRYIAEGAPARHSTRRGYLSLIHAHIRPRWGKTPLEDVHSYETEVWLLSLPIGSRRKGHIHGLMRVLFRFAMHIRWLSLEANPMHSFSIKGATKRAKEPGTLTHAQFHQLLEKIADEPYRTMVIAAQCLGLRISELLALQWADIDFLGARVTISKAIVEGRLGEVKTYQSARQLPLHSRIAQVFLAWRSQTEFTEPEQFIFASPWQAGELPYNASKIQSSILRARGKAIGLPFSLGWHTFRHTYRALLRQSGAPLDIQRDLMRHADIYITTKYGGTEVDELRPVNEKVVESLFGEKRQ
jgi:integrase